MKSRKPVDFRQQCGVDLKRSIYGGAYSSSDFFPVWSVSAAVQYERGATRVGFNVTSASRQGAIEASVAAFRAFLEAELPPDLSPKPCANCQLSEVAHSADGGRATCGIFVDPDDNEGLERKP